MRCRTELTGRPDLTAQRVNAAIPLWVRVVARKRVPAFEPSNPSDPEADPAFGVRGKGRLQQRPPRSRSRRAREVPPMSREGDLAEES